MEKKLPCLKRALNGEKYMETDPLNNQQSLLSFPSLSLIITSSPFEPILTRRKRREATPKTNPKKTINTRSKQASQVNQPRKVIQKKKKKFSLPHHYSINLSYHHRFQAIIVLIVHLRKQTKTESMEYRKAAPVYNRLASLSFSLKKPTWVKYGVRK